MSCVATSWALHPLVSSQSSQQEHMHSPGETQKCMESLCQAQKWEKPLVPTSHVPTPRCRGASRWSSCGPGKWNNWWITARLSPRQMPHVSPLQSLLDLCDGSSFILHSILQPLTCLCCLALVNLLTMLERGTHLFCLLLYGQTWQQYTLLRADDPSVIIKVWWTSWRTAAMQQNQRTQQRSLPRASFSK